MEFVSVSPAEITGTGNVLEITVRVLDSALVNGESLDMSNVDAIHSWKDPASYNGGDIVANDLDFSSSQGGSSFGSGSTGTDTLQMLIIGADIQAGETLTFRVLYRGDTTWNGTFNASETLTITRSDTGDSVDADISIATP